MPRYLYVVSGKLREIIHFEIFTDWYAILNIISIYITDVIQRTLFMSLIAFESHQFPSVFILLRKLLTAISQNAD